MLTYVLNRGGETSLYEQLYRALRADIESGALAAGARLPSKRAFAKHLGVSVVTVEGALDQLVAEGYVRAVPRSGFYVQEIGPNLASFSRVSTRGDRVQRNLGRSLSSTYHIPLDLDSLNVISWSTANRPRRKARKTCQKDGTSSMLQKRGAGLQARFLEIRFSGVQLSGRTFRGCFAGMKKDARWGVL